MKNRPLTFLMPLGRAAVLAMCLLLSGVSAALAQDQPDTVGSLPGIEIETSVDRAEVYIGDLITYVVSITYDTTYELVPPPLGANLGAFDVKDYDPDVIEKLNDGRVRSTTTFKLSTYTTGDYVIPPVPALFVLPDSSQKLLLAEPVPIRVLSLLEQDGSDSLKIRPPKPQYEFPPDYSAVKFWGAIGLIVILVGSIVAWIILRRGRTVEQEDLRPPWEIAFERLAFLKESGLINDEKYKDYYIELTDIARDYLGRMYELDVPEMTTEQYATEFSEVLMPDDLYAESLTFFRHADLVKFAKLYPERSRAEDDFLLIHRLVDSIRAEYEKQQEEARQVPRTSSGVLVTPVGDVDGKEDKA
ncbi:MAG: BatD family protein [candidate division Zixibacteria bacterium]|nr:BatD family protein [candidate division Zixibacteria bacterium]